MPTSSSPAARSPNTDSPNSPVEFGIRELIPNRIDGCACAPTGSRLNLVIPVISKRWTSGGGPATALRLFERLMAGFKYARIIVTHEMESQLDFHDWPGWVADDGGIASRSIAFLGERSTCLSVFAEDFFLATFWSTATYVKQVIERQAELFPGATRRFVYLIQDYEPAFYPWSARYAYAKSTYCDRDRVIAVFNSQSLADYFRETGHIFAEHHVFRPMLHPRLHRKKMEAGKCLKERLILVYGRPSVPRNDFDFVVEALRTWASTFPSAGEWSLVSAGEQHADIPLGGTVTLRSRGQLSLDDYARHLSQCWIGLSFMFSPHPSYPPLEMAEFGAWVVTNKFESKNLSDLAPNIISVDELTAEAVAERLAWCCGQYQPGTTAAINSLAPVFSGEGDEFPFAGTLVNSWHGRGVCK